MDFTNIMANWQNEGVAPSADLQANGFQAGQRPPASVFNWQWHRTSAAITELQEKLSGVASNAEVNQNAFSHVKVGDTTISAASQTDTIELEAGTNISITPDATDDKVTINNTYSLPKATSSTLGGVKAVAKTGAMTAAVGVDDDGQLWTETSSGDGGGGGTAIVDDAGVLSWGDVDSAVDTSIFSSYALKSQSEDVILSASLWGGVESPYTLPYSNSNITTTNVIELIPSVSITADQLKALQKANIIGGTQTSGSIVLKAMGTKPTIDIPVTMIIRGDI